MMGPHDQQGEQGDMTERPPNRPITFLSDFGSADEFVGVVHGVMAVIAPGCRIIDLHHRIPAGNVRAGALALLRAIQYMPPGVALAVVDPGVGTDRRAIALETEWGHLVGPDNGLLSPATALLGGATAAHSIENPDFLLPGRGATFQGRDRFAPAAAALASGEAKLSELGPAVDAHTLTPLLLPLAEVEEGRVTGVAWWVDGFGNVQTNISPEDLAEAGIAPEGEVTVRVGTAEYQIPRTAAYGEVGEGEALLHEDSSGLMALAVRGGRADHRFHLSESTAITFTSTPP